MKDSGVEWIGEIPEHWEVKRLKHVLENKPFAIVDGPFGTQLHSSEYVDDGIPLMNVSNIDKNGNFVFDNIKYISLEKFNELRRSEILPNDLLLAKTGATVGKICIFPKHIERALVSSRCLKISIDENIADYRFLFYFLYSSVGYDQIISHAKTTTMPGVNIPTINNLQITYPPKEEQKQIYDFLQKEISDFADLISKSQLQVNLLQEKRQALINHTVTKGLDPNVPMKDSGIEWIGEIPEHWEVKPLQMVASVLDPFPSHRAPPIIDDGFPYPGIGDLDKNGNLISNCRTVSETALKEQESRFKIELGDLAFARVATLGKIIHLRNDFRYCLSPTMAVLKPKINSLYLSYTLEAQYFQEQLIIVSTGSTRYAVGIMTLRKLKVVLPPKEEQKQIDNFLQKETTQLDDLISKSQLQINFLQEKRQAIITSTVTGKIDVRK